MSFFRVIIVGGGLGGLTLASCLQHAGIDFLVLEGREKIGLHVGAGVGIDPNGSRILDQLGVLSDLEEKLEPTKSWIFRNAEGRIICVLDLPKLVTQRTGYSAWVYERRCVLEALYDRIWDKEKILVDKRVQSVVYENDRPAVICKDGTKYAGDVIVGNDGVNSVVREEMWRLSQPGQITDADKEYLTCEYRGLYGISSAIEGIEPGTMTIILDKDRSCYWMSGKDGRIYWAFPERLEKVFKGQNIPKYSIEDAEDFAKTYIDMVLCSDTAKITFSNLWTSRQSWALVPIEEGDLTQWTVGRIVLMGDNVHKVTPESGQGANQAIESAACLANHLKRMVSQCSEKGPSSDDVERCLKQFQAKRRPRASAVVQMTNLHVRIFTLRNAFMKFMAIYGGSVLGDLQANTNTDRHLGAESIEFLPLPARSVTGTMPFNPTQGIAQYESRGQRALLALPLVVLGFCFHFPSSTKRTLEPMNQLLLNTPVHVIWMIESSRRANLLKPIQWTPLFGLLAHTQGTVPSVYLWFFLYYVWSPVEVYAALDQRLLNMNDAHALLPTLFFGYMLPTSITLFHPESMAAQKILSLSSWGPVLLSITHRVMARFMPDTTIHDRLFNVKADLPLVRRACVTAGVVALISFQYLRYNSYYPTTSWANSFGNFAKEDHTYFPLLVAQALWLILLFSDLKNAGMLEQSWIALLTYLMTCISIAGPGATLIAGWAWREEILASRRHWAAVVKAG